MDGHARYSPATCTTRFDFLYAQVGLGAIAASLIGWLIFVVCFGSFNDGDNL